MTQKGYGEDGMRQDHGREWAEIEVEPIRVTSMVRDEDIANEEGSLEVEDQGNDLESHQLARDRLRRTLKAPERYVHVDLVSYALLAIEDLDYSELINCVEAIGNKKTNSGLKL